MCGIVGAIAKRQVAEILLEGLRRLEYRGYDSAGIAIIDADGVIGSEKQVGKVSVLAEELHRHPLSGYTGIAHTRWATHGRPSQVNAHPHFSADKLALVHNGIIENHKELREELTGRGYQFVSQTDTETIVHLIHWKMQSGLDLLQAVKASVSELTGAFGLAVISRDEPDAIVCARSGSPLVIGLGMGENFLASDQLALRPVTDRFVYLDEGDIARITADSITIWDRKDAIVNREELWLTDQAESADKGRFRHYMLKEIFEQPRAIRRTLQGRLGRDSVLENAFGVGADQIFQQLKQVQIVACGTSYHSGLVAKYWIEEYAGVPCQVEIASEFRYRKMVVSPDTLFVAISQSGETADTLAALRLAKQLGYVATLAICNVAQSSLVRESDLVIMTEAGPEIGVASTKAFTTQLTALLMLMIVLGRAHHLKPAVEKEMVAALQQLPDLVEDILTLDKEIQQKAERFSEKKHALFLGRGIQYPVAMEGALKLKEISYIHAEAYPAGELKHGPLALVDSNMPIVAVAPNNDLLEKLKSNLEEVQARGGELFVFADRDAGFANEEHVTVTSLPHVPAVLEPIIYSIPLQLLAYHAAILKGTDVDQPRNLAKSVTVE